MSQIRRLRILHLASFAGNIGDLLNHEGFYRGIQHIPYEFEVTKLEIRDFYRKQRRFDADFVAEVNRHDCMVVGGGNYFELWVDHSPTGTSFMLPLDLFERIKIPVIFNALGCDIGMGAPEKNIKKFKDFLDSAFQRENSFLSVRNDGSLKTINSVLGHQYASRFHWTPDAGFNADYKSTTKMSERNWLAINLAGDMLDRRFDRNSSRLNFLTQLSKAIEQLIDRSVIESVCFIPHIYKDVGIIAEVLELLPDALVRERVVVAELTSASSLETLKNYYQRSDLVWATRFHANICAIGYRKPTIGMVNYPQIANLYDELGQSEWTCNTSFSGLGKTLVEKSIFQVQGMQHAIQKTADAQIEHYGRYMVKFENFLKGHFD